MCERQCISAPRGDAVREKRLHTAMSSIVQRWDDHKPAKTLGAVSPDTPARVGRLQQTLGEGVFEQMRKIWSKSDAMNRGKWCGLTNLKTFMETPVGLQWSKVDLTTKQLVSFINNRQFIARFRDLTSEDRDCLDPGEDAGNSGSVGSDDIGRDDYSDDNDLDRDEDSDQDSDDDDLGPLADDPDLEGDQIQDWARCDKCEQWRVLAAKWTALSFTCDDVAVSCTQPCDSTSYCHSDAESQSQHSNARVANSPSAQMHSFAVPSPLVAPPLSQGSMSSAKLSSPSVQPVTGQLFFPRTSIPRSQTPRSQTPGDSGAGKTECADLNCAGKDDKGFVDDRDGQYYCYGCWVRHTRCQNADYDFRMLPFCTVTFAKRTVGSAVRRRGKNRLFYTRAEAEAYEKSKAYWKSKAHCEDDDNGRRNDPGPAKASDPGITVRDSATPMTRGGGTAGSQDVANVDPSTNAALKSLDAYGSDEDLPEQVQVQSPCARVLQLKLTRDLFLCM